MDQVFRQMWRDYKALVKPGLLMAATWIGFAFAYHFNIVNPFLQVTGWPLRFDEAGAARFQEAVASVRMRWLPLFAVQTCFYLFFHLTLIFTCRQVRREKPDFRKALGSAARRWPAYAATTALLILFALGVAGGLYYLGITLSPLPPGVPPLRIEGFTPVHGAMLATGLLLALYLGLRLNLFPFAVGLEKAGPRKALAHSWKLTKGQWWSMFMALVPLALLLLMIIFGVSIVASLPFTVPAGLTPGLGLPLGQYAPGTYPLALSWNQAETLAMNTALFVFLFDIPFTYGHMVVWEMATEPERPLPRRAPKPKRAGPPPPPERPKPARPIPEMGAWKLPPEPAKPPGVPKK